MNKWLVFLSLLFCSTISLHGDEQLSRHVLVSVAPHKYFVEKIAGDTVSVDLMVPAGASMHTFEPTPKQMVAASKADLWFQIGEFFEARATQSLKSHHSKMILVDLRKGLDLINSEDDDDAHCACCLNHNCMDPHIWMSLRLAQTQAKTIARYLSEVYPENKEKYNEALKRFLVELEQTDKEITKILQNAKNRTFMVSHPAYGYFCRDYQLKQISIEFEGKDPTPQQLTKILKKARDANIQTIFIQKQYNNKGARLIATELGAKVEMLDPYSEDYLNSMREIASRIAEG